MHGASTFEWAESFRQYLNPACLAGHCGNTLETFVSFRLCWSWTVYQLHPSAWHCNGSLMGCSACLNALLNPGAIWWGMRFWFLAVRLKLWQKWNEKKNQWALSRHCQNSTVMSLGAQSSASLGTAKSCDMSHTVPGLASKHPRCRSQTCLQSPGQTDRQLRGLGGCGLGCPIWPQTHFKSDFLMTDPTVDGTEQQSI